MSSLYKNKTTCVLDEKVCWQNPWDFSAVHRKQWESRFLFHLFWLFLKLNYYLGNFKQREVSYLCVMFITLCFYVFKPLLCFVFFSHSSYFQGNEKHLNSIIGHVRHDTLYQLPLTEELNKLPDLSHAIPKLFNTYINCYLTNNRTYEDLI